ncbi:MAG: STAS domain-containing protein [Rivularia sp. (in: Bacteria)]|nr:STAS domain-containing protein [Rivularia sp. MS3]
MQTILESQQFTIIKPQNSITAANAYLLEKKLTTALRQNSHLNILVDMQQVEFMDSSGLMALISSCKLAQSLQKRFSLCSISNGLKIIIELTQLDNAFEIFASEAAYKETL